MGQGKEIKQNWTGTRAFDICFCVTFNCYCPILFSGRENGDYALPLTNFEILQIFSSVLKSYVSCRQLMREPLIKAYYSRNQVLLYLWRIKTILK